MRIMLIVIGAMVAMFLDLRVSRAYDGPWCAVTNLGRGSVYWNCSMRNFEMCRQEVIAGNRGFCIANPYLQGSWTAYGAGKSYRRYRGY